MRDQAEEHQQGGGDGFAGRDHEEVEEDQWVDPEQAVDAQVDGDQRRAHGKHGGQVDARFFRIAGAPGVGHGG